MPVGESAARQIAGAGAATGRDSTQLSLMQRLGARCEACPFAKNGRPDRPVLGEGPPDAVGVLVGEGPGAEEQETGRPFCGPTGKELDNSLERAGLGRGKLFVVNATACRPTIGGKTDALMSQAVACCAPAFKAQLAPHAKKPVLAMGKWAGVALGDRIPKGGLTKGRGFLRKLADGTPYIATWHPTYAFFHNAFEWGAFDVDTRRFRRLLRGELRQGPTELLVHPNIRRLDDLLDAARGSSPRPISVDIECGPEHPDAPWTGKDPTRARLRTIGFGNIEWGMSLIWSRLTDSEKQKVAQAFAGLTIWQNGPWYDHRVLTRFGYRIGPWDDTRDLRRALVASSPLSLAYMASLYDDTNPWKEEDEDDDKGLVFTEDMDELCTYNAQDCVETARVWEGASADGVEAGDWWKRLYEAHKRTSVICAKMHSRGIKVHVENRNRLSRELEAEFYKREGVLKELVGLPDFKANPNNMRALVFRRHAKKGIPCFDLPDPFDDDRWSSDGTISVDQAHLMELATSPMTPPKLVDIINTYWQAYAVRQAKSTFVDSDKVEHAIGLDGRLRPGWNSCGTDTGRKSSSEPNVMNLSKEKD